MGSLLGTPHRRTPHPCPSARAPGARTGRSDHVCIPKAAWRLVKGLEDVSHACELRFIAGAGHSDSEPAIAAALREATDALRYL